MKQIPYQLLHLRAGHRNAAAHRTHSLKLNETSEFLWDALVKGADETQLVTLAAKEFEASEEDLPVLRDDIRHFISGLAANNIIILSDSAEPYSSLYARHYWKAMIFYTLHRTILNSAMSEISL